MLYSLVESFVSTANKGTSRKWVLSKGFEALWWREKLTQKPTTNGSNTEGNITGFKGAKQSYFEVLCALK